MSLTFVLDADGEEAVISLGSTAATLTEPTTPTPPSHELGFAPDPGGSEHPSSTTASVDISNVPVTNVEWTLERNDLEIEQPGRVKDLIVVVRFDVTVPGA